MKSQDATLKFKRKSEVELVIGWITIPFGKHTEIKLPGKQKTLVTLPIKETTLKSEYVARIQVGPGIYMGEALVTPKNGNISLYVVNSTPENIELTVPLIGLEDFTLANSIKPSLNKIDPSIEKEVAHAKRLCEIVGLLDLKHLNDEEKGSFLQIINSFPYQFHLPTDKWGCTDVVAHWIDIKQYRQPQFHKKEIKEHVATLLKDDAIQSSSSPYNSPTWIVPEIPDSQGRVKTGMIIDYRGLNEKTVGAAYPLPNICDILDQLGGAKYFSTFDLASGFRQIPVDPESQPKTAFSTLRI